jgi:hypothetical protein
MDYAWPILRHLEFVDGSRCITFFGITKWRQCNCVCEKMLLLTEIFELIVRFQC